MSTRNNPLLLLVLGIALLLGAAPRSEAKILIFKVTFTGTPLFFPKAAPNGNLIKSTGYVIYDSANPGNSHAIELFSKTKKYIIDGAFLSRTTPGAIGFGNLDRNGDGFFETASALLGFNNAGAENARAYIGTNPRPPGFKVGGQFFTGPKMLKGKGAVTVGGVDHFTIADTWTLDPLSGLAAVFNSNNSADGVTAVQVFIESKGYSL